MAPLYPVTDARPITGLLTSCGQITLSPEVLSAIGALLPIVTYPFIPSWSMQERGSVLLWSSSINLVFFHLGNTFMWFLGDDMPYAHVQLWVLPLTFLSFLASMTTLDRYGGVQAQRDDFGAVASITFGIILYQLLKPGYSLLDMDHIMSLQNLLIALIWSTGVIILGGASYEPVVDLLTTGFHRFMTRRVSWWCWLPNRDDEAEFKPAWSCILMMFVVVAAPILVFFEIKGMDEMLDVWRAARKQNLL